LPVVEDTPRSAYSVLERRATLTTVSVLLGLAGVSWWSTLGNVRDMSSMVQGFAHVGTAMPFDMSVTVFMVMWLTMMVAMMFPTIAPIVLLHRMVLRRRGEGLVPTVAFGSGYLVVWVVVGIVPLATLIGFRNLAAGSSLSSVAPLKHGSTMMMGG
jgi:predicted metal-binding membrane protein